jgi:60 kDa SS-A/Ro ribonucleoprotein
MANKSIFNTRINRAGATPATNTVNEAGGTAYAFSAQHALAQYAATGCMNDGYYQSGEVQVDKVLELANKVSPLFVAKTALYARERGFMKDMPAFLCAVLAKRDVALLEKVFDRVINNGKMLRNFVQIIRSGKVGRKSLGSAPKRLVQSWIDECNDEKLFDASVGNDPSLCDIIKMVHPHPKDRTRAAFYAYLIGKLKPEQKRYLPKVVKQYEAFKDKDGDHSEVPAVDFRLLTALDLGKKEWIEIARNAKWHMTRMNLNTFERHGVFEDRGMVKLVADRLRDPEQIKKSMVFPYQLMTAYLNVDEKIPMEITNALQDAVEVACDNVPEIDGKVYIFPDVSGSMSSPITGHRGTATTKMRCIDIAALISAAFMRKNQTAEVIPFEGDVVEGIRLNPRDSIMTNAQKLSSHRGGSTNCSAPLSLLNRRNAKGDLLVYVSDNESWVDSGRYRSTATMVEFNRFKQRNPKAKMVCIDIQSYGSTQAAESKDILNVGGFSDDVFTIIADFAAGNLSAAHWVGEIERMSV